MHWTRNGAGSLMVLVGPALPWPTTTKHRLETIDHKDESGEYRESVLHDVLSLFEAAASPVSNRSEMVGTWRLLPPPDDSFPDFPVIHYEFLESGEWKSTSRGSPSDPRNKWRLNEDGTLSLLRWTPCPHGIRGEPGHEEQRLFVRALADGQRVLWNGDGSLIKVLQPVPAQPGASPNSGPATRSDNSVVGDGPPSVN
jgi:hypothetical protein